MVTMKGGVIMNTIDIKIMLKEKGGNVKNAAKEMDIKQPTMQDILSKGIENTSVKNLIKIAKYLNLKLDDIVNKDYEYNSKNIVINDINDMIGKLNNDELIIMKNITENIIKIKESK